MTTEPSLLSRLAENAAYVVSGLGLAATGAAAWWLKFRRADSGTELEVKQNAAAANALEDLRKDNDRLRAQMLAADERADRAEAGERQHYTLLVQTQSELRMAQRDLERMRRRLKAAGVPDSDWMPHMETNFGALPPSHP
jgi:type II secretory pathway pseudopilin PulG